MRKILDNSGLQSQDDANYTLVSPSLSFLKGGSQVEEVARQRLHTFWCFTWKYRLCFQMRHHYQVQVSLLRMCYLLDQGARVFSHIGYHFKLLTIGSQSSTYLGQVGMDDIGRRCWTSTVDLMETQTHLNISLSQQVSFVEGSSILGTCYF